MLFTSGHKGRRAHDYGALATSQQTHRATGVRTASSTATTLPESHEGCREKVSPGAGCAEQAGDSRA